MSAAYQTTFSIPPTHPALPGHFPGDPLVPGVVLLEQVALALRAWRDERLVRVAEAKFMAPLLPDELAELSLSQVGERARFDIRRGGQLLARGVVEGARA